MHVWTQHCCAFVQRRNVISITYSECLIVALGAPHAMCMRHIVFFGLSGSATYLPQIMKFKKRHDFLKTKLLNTKCVFWFSLQILSKTFLILRELSEILLKNVYWSSWKVPVTCVRFQSNLNFLVGLTKNTWIPNFINIRPVEAELLRPDRQTWRS
jgi:hypothetical protein